MNYKKIYYLLAALMLVVASCSKSTDVLEESIPKDAYSVVRVDMKSIIEKSNYNLWENPTVKRAINILKATYDDPKAVKLIEAFEKDANAFGLTLNSEMFVFQSSGVYGWILPVNDAEKLKESLIRLKTFPQKEVKEKDGNFVVNQDGFSVAWNEEKMVLCTATLFVTEGVKRDTISADAFLTQKESILQNKLYAEHRKIKADISTFAAVSTTLSQLEKVAGATSKPATAEEKQLAENFKGVESGTYLNFEKGEIVGTSQYYYADDTAKQRWEKYQSEIYGTISNKYLYLIGERPLLTLASNVNGQKITQVLAAMGLWEVAKTFASGFPSDQIQSVLNLLKGDILLSLNGISRNQEAEFLGSPKVRLAMAADLHSPQAADTLIQQFIASEYGTLVEKNADGFYEFPMNGNTILFGVQNGTFSLTVGDNPPAKVSADKIVGNRSYAYSDWQEVCNVIALYTQEQAWMTPIIDFLRVVENIEGSDSAEKGNRLTIRLVNKEQNSLATICKQLDTMLNAYGSQVGM